MTGKFDRLSNNVTDDRQTTDRRTDDRPTDGRTAHAIIVMFA